MILTDVILTVPERLGFEMRSWILTLLGSHYPGPTIIAIYCALYKCFSSLVFLSTQGFPTQEPPSYAQVSLFSSFLVNFHVSMYWYIRCPTNFSKRDFFLLIPRCFNLLRVFVCLQIILSRSTRAKHDDVQEP